MLAAAGFGFGAITVQAAILMVQVPVVMDTQPRIFSRLRIPNSRNMEFDPKPNWFKNLPPLERVNAP
jgi:hypothetical protein